MTDESKKSPQFYQEEDYNFPYHHLPQIKNGSWNFGLSLFDTFDYLTLMEFILNEIKKDSPKTILDFGCGDGRLTKEIINRFNSEIYGVDISQKALTFAKILCNITNKNLIFFNNLKDLPSIKFDFIVATEVIEHIDEKELPNVLRDIYEIISDDGTFLITVPSIIRQPIPKKHYRHYTLELLQEQLGEFFIIEKINYLNKKSNLN
ncbi:MAG: hypothetical protein CL506_00250, partial [Actinobacteria bacterium]|nr:hypothetical protein [Actinomycetota bacterium]